MNDNTNAEAQRCFEEPAQVQQSGGSISHSVLGTAE